MDVFGKGTDEPSRPLLNPGICFICENSPTQSEQKVIDTRREFNPPNITWLSGRKYVCESCAREHGAAMGMVSAEDHAKALESLDDFRIRAVELENKLVQAESEQVKVVSLATAKKLLKTDAVGTDGGKATVAS